MRVHSDNSGNSTQHGGSNAQNNRNQASGYNPTTQLQSQTGPPLVSFTSREPIGVEGPGPNRRNAVPNILDGVDSRQLVRLYATATHQSQYYRANGYRQY